MGVIYNDLPDHEGYGEPVEESRFRAACACGWGADDRLASYDAAVELWDEQHAIPLLAAAVPAELAESIAALQRAVEELRRDRPLAAQTVVADLERWARRLSSPSLVVATSGRLAPDPPGRGR